MKITSWKENLKELEPLEPRLQEIFFLSSLRKNFLTPEEKQRFYEKWTQYYFEFWPEDVWLATNDEGTSLLGYLMGCRNSKEAKAQITAGIPSYEAFEDQFIDFNCHLHINCHPDTRGMGIGASLIKKYIQTIKDAGNSGVHIITSPKARNINFYKRAGFTTTLERNWRGYNLLFMGQKF